MQRSAACLILLIACCPSFAEKPKKPSKAELEAITVRGRALAGYDQAAWHSTDAVLAMKPPEGAIRGYLARQTAAGWIVVYGSLNETHDKFLVAYEATQADSPEHFTVAKYDPPREDPSYLNASRARLTALSDFKGEVRPYNLSVLPADSGCLYVYVYPAPVKAGFYPLGGDVRYLTSPDGLTIIEKRQMHKGILDMDPGAEGEAKAKEGWKMKFEFHTHVLSDLPEDTDVFHVLAQPQHLPSAIRTEHFLYMVRADGAITIVETYNSKK